MACTGCGSTACRGCKDMKIILPTSVGVSTVVDNGDGTFTITLTNGTATIINTATPPNDAWVEKEETNVAQAPANTGTSTNNSITMDLAYKVLNIDTVLVRCQILINADITALNNSINCNFKLGTITSNWFTGTKLATGTYTSFQSWSPISIITTTGTTAIPNQVGRAYASQSPATDGLFTIGNTNVQMPDGTYDFVIDFEITCKLV